MGGIGAGVLVEVGVVVGVDVGVAVGGIGVGVNVEVGVGVNVEVGVGVNAGPRICPGPQLAIRRLIAHRKITNFNFLVLILISFAVIGILGYHSSGCES